MLKGSLVLASLFFPVLFDLTLAFAQGSLDWRGDECLVSDPTGTPFNVRQSPKGPVVTTLRNGEGVVYAIRREDPWVEVHKVTNGSLTKLGWAWRKYIDCYGERERTRYPIYFRDLTQMIELGIAWWDAQQLPLFNSRRASFTTCPFQGEGDTIAISKDIVAAHERRGFSLPKLCLMLAAGTVRYDPVTGERLPTYLFSGWPDYGLPKEFLLKVPDCFKAGAISGMGTYLPSFKPTGCQLNYHPWTGRRLSADEKPAYAIALTIKAGGEAGPSPSQESQIRESNLPAPSTTSLGEIKRGLSK
jgi:hypothetical protein